MKFGPDNLYCVLSKSDIDLDTGFKNLTKCEKRLSRHIMVLE